LSLKAGIQVASTLGEKHLGPAHVWIRRSIEHARSIPASDVRFEEGLRVYPGVPATGSHLLRKKTLVRLLNWPHPAKRPHLVVILVDEDGDGKRYSRLTDDASETLPAKTNTLVVAVARQEFEAWLLSDTAALRATLGIGTGETPTPEDMQPGEAKQQFVQLMRVSAEKGAEFVLNPHAGINSAEGPKGTTVAC
jgi:hypothetical protein